jgi:exoribonuclease R
LPVEGWNAQISLLTGMCAARMMRAAGIGVQRTLPPADPADLARLRRTASALRIDWPEHVQYAELIPTLDPEHPPHAAFLDAATVALRGAGYAAFDGDVPADASHAALAADYAHVTAPLRRLVDRYGLEICAAVTAGTAVPEWVREALDALPGEMADSDRRAGVYQGACLNLMEAAALGPLVGQDFTGVVVAVGDDGVGDLVVPEPAVQGAVTGADLPLGAEITARLVEASIERRRITFAHVRPGSAD